LGALVEIYRRKETQKRAVAVACRNSIVTSSSHKEEEEDERIERKEKGNWERVGRHPPSCVLDIFLGR
jgi:hypothetical protein